MKIILCLLLSFVVAACDSKEGAAQSTDKLTITKQDGTKHAFKIELALTPQQQQQGLMNRTEMAKNAGMLFFFGPEAPRSFWMKNTLIPLDMIFIKKDGVILNIHDSAIPNDLTSVKSEGPVSAVLEVNGGLSKKLGIVAGDKVHHVLFGN